MIISHWILLRMRNVSDKIKTHIARSVTFFPRKSYSLWDNVEKYDRIWRAKDDIAWSMLISRWIPKATNTHSQYVIFIAFSLQILKHERTLPLLFLPNIGCSSSCCLQWTTMNHTIDIIVLKDKITDKHLMVMEGDVSCCDTLAT